MTRSRRSSYRSQAGELATASVTELATEKDWGMATEVAMVSGMAMAMAMATVTATVTASERE